MKWLESLKEILSPTKGQEDRYQYRYSRLQSLMLEKGIDHLLIEDPIDVYYLTGIYFNAGSFLAHLESKPDFMVDSRYFEELKNGYWKSYLIDKGFWTRFWQRSAIKSVGFDPDKVTYSRFQDLSDQAVDFGMRLEPHRGIMSQLQRVKDVDQLQKMLLAGQLASEALNEAILHLKAGVSEKQIARLIRLYFVERGADVSFEPIVAFGAHGAIPHHAPTDNLLEEGQMVMIDLGAKLNRYCSDMTRSFFFKQAGNPEVGRLWQLTYQAYELACAMLKPGVSCHAIDRKVREFFRKEHMEERFLHSLGHGIGLRVHEFPRIRVDSSVDYTLEVGSVITIEPGLYIPSLGGVRLENTLVITETGYQELTPHPFERIIG